MVMIAPLNSFNFKHDGNQLWNIINKNPWLMLLVATFFGKHQLTCQGKYWRNQSDKQQLPSRHLVVNPKRIIIPKVGYLYKRPPTAPKVFSHSPWQNESWVPLLGRSLENKGKLSLNFHKVSSRCKISKALVLSPSPYPSTTQNSLINPRGVASPVDCTAKPSSSITGPPGICDRKLGCEVDCQSPKKVFKISPLQFLFDSKAFFF